METSTKRLYSKFLKTVKCGLEIECNLPNFSDSDESCYHTNECSICNSCPVCDNCTICEDCSCNSFYCFNHCDSYSPSGNHGTTCVHRTDDMCVRDDGEEDICDFCHDIDRCSNCYRCDDCDPREWCDSTCYDDDSPHWELAGDLNCNVGKGNRKKDSDFWYVYNDGSVNTEVVTAPLPLSQIKPTHQKAIAVLRNYDADISPRCGAGGHQNFGFNGYFPEDVVRNAIQLVRYYLPALLTIGCVDGSHNRGVFRGLPVCGWRAELPNGKYQAVHIKKKYAVGVTAGEADQFEVIEFRYPDSTTDSRKVRETAIINAGLIAKAIKISDAEVMRIPQDHFNKVRENVQSFYAGGVFSDGPFTRSLLRQLRRDVKPELTTLKKCAE